MRCLVAIAWWWAAALGEKAIGLSGISAVMKKLQFGDEFAGYILCDFWMSYFSKPCRFLRPPGLFWLSVWPITFLLSKLFCVNLEWNYLPFITWHIFYPWRFGSNYTQRKVLQTPPTSIRFSALVSKRSCAQTLGLWRSFVVNLLNILRE